MTIERFNNSNPPELSDTDMPARYRQPSIFTAAGQLDRKHEGDHVVRMRDKQRETIEAAADQQSKAIKYDAWLQHRGHAVTDSKWAMVRAETESKMTAGDNPVLQTKAAILDDDMFQSIRRRLAEWK